MKKNTKIFILIHGAWHGGWAWSRVVPRLVQAGYTVFAPSLTGMGEKAHLSNPEVGLNTHIQDVLTLLEKENLKEVILVGHSYAGMVISGVAEKAPERISQLVYLDAIVPKDGQSLAEIMGAESFKNYRQAAKEYGKGWLIPPPPVERFGITSEPDIVFTKTRLVSQPIKTYEERVYLNNPAALPIPRSFIYLNKPAYGRFDEYAKAAKNSKDWRYFEIATSHDAMILEPQKLSEVLLKIAGQ